MPRGDDAAGGEVVAAITAMIRRYPMNTQAVERALSLCAAVAVVLG
jgi:hypothetical protein